MKTRTMRIRTLKPRAMKASGGKHLAPTLAVTLGIALGIALWRPAAGASTQPGQEPTGTSAETATATATAADDLVSRAVGKLESLDLLALAVAERRVVIRQGDDLHVVSVGDSLPGADDTWLRQVRADRVTVQLPGGRAAHWYADRPDNAGRIELLEPTAPSDSIPPSPPYLIPIRRAQEPPSADEGGTRP